MKMELGYPWGVVDALEGYTLQEVEAACGSHDHFGHPFCAPGWEEDLPEGAVVVAGPILDSCSGWIALVAIPLGAPLVGRPFPGGGSPAPGFAARMGWPLGRDGELDRQNVARPKIFQRPQPAPAFEAVGAG